MMGQSRWYVLQVRTGTEENIRIQCEKNIPTTVLECCFIPYYKEQRNIRGIWTTQQKRLFPGYLFAITTNVDALHLHLKKVTGLSKILGTGREIVPLRKDEIQFLQEFGGDEQIVEMSQGIIENEKIIVQYGPLKGKEGYIRRIDRHKRKAYLELELFGRMQRIQVGLEVVAKS